jgi:chemotaxis protein MotB
MSDAGHASQSDDHDDDDHGGGGGGHGGGDHEEGGHGEPWLVSYADLMTLLFGFFVIMYTFAQAKNKAEDASYAKVKMELVKYFGGVYVNPMEDIEKKLQRVLATQPQLSKSLQIKSDNEGVKVIIQSQVLFEKGSADIATESVPILNTLIGLIKDANPEFIVRITGYTDDVPIHTQQFPSNWELSSARASTVVRMFEAAAYNPENLIAAGYGSSHPAYPNRDDKGVPIPENQARNRRIVMSISQPNESAPATPIGQGKQKEIPIISDEAVGGGAHGEHGAPAEAAPPAHGEAPPAEPPAHGEAPAAEPPAHGEAPPAEAPLTDPHGH